MAFKQISIIGLGLIGGSVAKAVKHFQPDTQISAYDTCADTLTKAINDKTIDTAAESIEAAAQTAELVIVAVPIEYLESTFRNLYEASCRHPNFASKVITDVSSIKGRVVEMVESIWPECPDYVIPGHPIAGKEHAGFDHACHDLFVKHPVILTPIMTNANLEKVKELKAFWASIKAQPVLMEHQHHDAVLAGTSHLPHLLSYALMKVLSDSPLEKEIFEYAAGGLRDFSRIAASDPKLWADICFANYDSLAPYLEQLAKVIEDVNLSLKNQNKQQLIKIFSQAKDARSHFESILKERE